MTTDATPGAAWGPSAARACPVTASAPAAAPDCLDAIARGLGPGPFALVYFFASPEADLDALCTRAARQFPQAAICGCSTAGEITGDGYAEGQVVGFAFPRAGFDVELVIIEDLDRLDARALIAELHRARQSLGRRAFDHRHECAVLLVDGLSGQEDTLVASLSGGLGPVPLVGGSAGDGTAFRRTFVHAGGRLLNRGGVIALLRSHCTIRPFSLDHLVPSEARMVVTRADPERRTVARINDEPAAREYARLLGLRVEQLSPYIFAAHPVLVRAGGRHHVRAIQCVGPEESLQFFAAIAEGLVLTIAEPTDIAAHLQQELGRFARETVPSAILGFDCIFRRIEAEGRQRGREVSDILAQHRVAGFSTYGEQTGAMHVNQTLTGLVFYPPPAAWAGGGP